MMPWPDEQEEFTLTPDRLFIYAGRVTRQNYRRSWSGSDYRICCGRFKGSFLSAVTSEKWLVWALNQFENQLEHDLYRALIDQLNSLHH